MIEEQYLVIARTSSLRTKLFSKLGEAGLRLDAVGSERSALRRLEKDEYKLILFEDVFPNLKLSKEEYPLYPIQASDEERLEELIQDVLKIVRPE